jgi:hypothetical protein
MKIASFIIFGCHAGPTRPIGQLQQTQQVDCSAYFEKFDQGDLFKGPRPNPDPIMDDDPIADMPDQFTEDQIKYCKDQLDITLWRKWLNEKTIEITECECADFRSTAELISDRGPRPDFESYANVDSEDQSKNVLGIDDLPSNDLIEIYCDEYPLQECATIEPITLSPEPTGDPEPTSVIDYDANYPSAPLPADDVFEPEIFDDASQIFIQKHKEDICEVHANVCCPLFQRKADVDNFVGFPKETATLLENEEAKTACAKNKFMPCCVTPELCNLYPDMPHCSKGNRVSIVATSTSTTSTTSSTTSTTTTETSSVAGTTLAKEGTADTIVGDNGPTDGPDGRFMTDSPDNEQERRENSARTGMILIFTIIGMIVLLVAGVLIARHFWTGGEAVVSKDEDASLIANNVPEQSPQPVQQQQSM